MIITSQKIMPKTQLPEAKFTLTGERVIVYPFSLYIHGDGEIHIENTIKNKDGNPIPRFDLNAHVTLGKMISGKKLYGFSKRRFGKITVGGLGRTSAHPCQSTEVRESCYLKVWQSYSGINDLIHPQKLYNTPKIS